MTFIQKTIATAVASACFSGGLLAQTASTPPKSLTVFSTVSAPSSLSAAQWTQIRGKMTTPLRAGVAAGVNQQAQFRVGAMTTLRASIRADGTWPDIDYANNDIVNWDPMLHLDRLHTLVLCYTTKNNDLYRNRSLKNDIVKVYRAWLAKSPVSRNWFPNQISVPNKMANIILLLKTDDVIDSVLNVSDKASAFNIVHKAYIPRSINQGTNTGANRIDRASITLRSAVVEEDEALAQEPVGAISDVIKMVGPTTEGIQRDYSFHQHGPQLYMGGYGLNTWKFVDMFAWVDGTSLAFSNSYFKLLTDLMLNGYARLTRGKTIHPAAAGRQVTFLNGISTSAVLSAVNKMLQLNSDYRRQELIAYQQELDAAWKGRVFEKLENASYFYASDAAAYHSSQLSVFIKTSTPSTFQPETGNRSGLKNLHLADGTQFFVKNGDEYLNTLPFLNWRNLPGTTTAVNSTYSLKPAVDWGVSGTAVNVGGASNAGSLLSFMDYARNRVSEKKTWVAVDGQIIYLGANVTAPASVGLIMSSVNQVQSTGRVVYSDGANALELNSDYRASSGISWIWHNGLAYYFPVAVNLSFGTRAVSASWDEINAGLTQAVSVKNMFSLSVNHGVSPQGRNFHYVVKSADAPELVKPADLTGLTVSRNDPSAQVVRYEPSAGNKTISGVFWASNVGVENISTSSPVGLILNRDVASRKISLTLSPIAKSSDKPVTVTLAQLYAMNLVSSDPSIQVTTLGETTRLTFNPFNRNGKAATVTFSF